MAVGLAVQYPADFEKALAFTLVVEGGFANVAGDSGGRTMAGITQALYDEYRALGRQPRRPVEQSTAAERKDVYFHMVWLRGRCDVLAAPASLVHFDSVTNHGPGAAAMILQAIVKARPIDGGFGPKTLAATVGINPRSLALNLVAARRGFYIGLLVEEQSDSDRKFVEGWLNRMDHLERALG